MTLPLVSTAAPHAPSVQQNPWFVDAAIGAGLFVGALILALAVHYALERGLRRLTERRKPALFHIIRETRGLTRLAFVLLALHVVLPALPLTDAADTLIHSALTACFILLVGWVVLAAMNICDRRLSRPLRHHRCRQFVGTQLCHPGQGAAPYRRWRDRHPHRGLCPDGVSRRCANSASACSPRRASRGWWSAWRPARYWRTCWPACSSRLPSPSASTTSW